VLDEDYRLVLVAPARAVMPRDRWLDVLKDYIVHDYAVEEQMVDEDGDCAAVLSRVRMTATVLGEDRSGTFAISDVWRRRDDGWRIWRRHSTPLSAGPMPGAGQ
jgi:ketosteroid isomerase-like protein